MQRNIRERLQLFSQNGQRKYLTRAELHRFINESTLADRQTRTLCLCLAFTGCRITEALQLTANRISMEEPAIVFRSLKQRGAVRHREVPVPEHVVQAIDLVHEVRKSQQHSDGGEAKKLWPWHRATAWRHISAVMQSAGVVGPQACPKGLRHGFGVAAVQCGVPLNMIKKWMGHSDIAMTAIYADAIGAEERDIAGQLWRGITPAERIISKLPVFKHSDSGSAEPADRHSVQK